MELKNKIIFFLITTVLLGTITFFVIYNLNNKNEEPIPEENKVESIDYEKYQELRSKAYEQETYAILIWESTDEPSKAFLEEIKIAFKDRKSMVYTIDTKELSREDFSRVIDDVTSIMKYEKPSITVPTLIIMSRGDIVFTRVGLMYSAELIEHLDAKSIE